MRDREKARRERLDQEFEEALHSMFGGKTVQIVAPNGTLVSAICTKVDIEQDSIEVGIGQYVPGMRSVQLILQPMPPS